MSRSAPIPSLETLAEAFEPTLRAYVAEAAAEAVPVLHEGMIYALGLDEAAPTPRPKRIRPALCLVTAEALGAGRAAAEPFALAIELAHNFCLVHDDIEDGDVMRRGRPSVWKRYGPPHAINIGDYLLILAYRALSRRRPGERAEATRLRLVELLTWALERTHVGQALDLAARERRSFAVEDYLGLAREKTGRYLAAPIEAGAIVAGAPEAVIAELRRLGDCLGPLFQIRDDLLDLESAKGREAPGADLREGKRSYLVAHAAACAAPADADRLFNILDRPREATTAADVAWAADLFARTGALEAARAACDGFLTAAHGLVSPLPPPLGAALSAALPRLGNRKR